MRFRAGVVEMARTLVFDAGPIINLALNGLLFVLEGLRERFGGLFVMPSQVKRELIDVPLHKRRFQFEALQILELLRKNALAIRNLGEADELRQEMTEVANTIYSAHGHPIRILHDGEIAALALAVKLGAEGVVIDERTTRYLIEKPTTLHKRLEGKLHTKVVVDRKKLRDFSRMTRKLRVLRSTELVAVAFELGFLDRYLPETAEGEKTLIESLLWALKLHGCAISDNELFALSKLSLAARKVNQPLKNQNK